MPQGGPPAMPGAMPLGGPPPYGGPPGMPPQLGASAKTMIAQSSPFQQQHPQQHQQPQPGGMGAPQPYQALGASQKTIVAGMSSPMMGPMPGQMPGQMPPGMMPHGQMPQMPPQMIGPNGGAPNKTVLLQPSEGVVSVAQRGGQGLQVANMGAIVQGASALYWVVCLTLGIAAGVIAYVIVLQM